MLSSDSLKELTVEGKFLSWPKLIQEHDLVRVCEIGVRNGDHFARLSNPELHVLEAVAVDLWRDDSPAKNDMGYTQEKLDDQYLNVVRRFWKDKHIRILRTDSVSASKLFPDWHFDFVYIDADHSFKGCYADLCAWWPKVERGGVFCGDDFRTMTSPTGVEFGVIQAVTSFAEENKLKVYLLPRKSWAILKE